MRKDLDRMHPAQASVRATQDVWLEAAAPCSGMAVGLSFLWEPEPEVADGVNHLREVKITHGVRSYYIKDVKVGEVIIG